MKNADVDAMNVTIVTQQTVDGEAVGDKVVNVPTGNTMLIGPFPKDVYNDTDGKVQVTYDDETSVSVGAVRLIANQ